MNLADITGCLSKTLKIEENNKQIPVLGGSGCVRGGVHPNGGEGDNKHTYHLG